MFGRSHRIDTSTIDLTFGGFLTRIPTRNARLTPPVHTPQIGYSARTYGFRSRSPAGRSGSRRQRFDFFANFIGRAAHPLRTAPRGRTATGADPHGRSHACIGRIRLSARTPGNLRPHSKSDGFSLRPGGMFGEFLRTPQDLSENNDARRTYSADCKRRPCGENRNRRSSAAGRSGCDSGKRA